MKRRMTKDDGGGGSGDGGGSDDGCRTKIHNKTFIVGISLSIINFIHVFYFSFSFLVFIFISKHKYVSHNVSEVGDAIRNNSINFIFNHSIRPNAMKLASFCSN